MGGTLKRQTSEREHFRKRCSEGSKTEKEKVEGGGDHTAAQASPPPSLTTEKAARLPVEYDLRRPPVAVWNTHDHRCQGSEAPRLQGSAELQVEGTLAPSAAPTTAGDQARGPSRTRFYPPVAPPIHPHRLETSALVTLSLPPPYAPARTHAITLRSVAPDSETSHKAMCSLPCSVNYFSEESEDRGLSSNCSFSGLRA